MKTELLSINSDAKTVKGMDYGVLTGILYLWPHRYNGRNVCPNASEGCIAACLNTAGRGIIPSVQTARKRKTDWFFSDLAGFMAQLQVDIARLVEMARIKGMEASVRLNGTSDLPWERIRNPATGKTLLETFPSVQFYDYTKSEARALACARGEMPGNYDLTFSRSESNGEAWKRVRAAGGRVAMVFSEIPERYDGEVTVNGDTSDIRFRDPRGSIVALRAKGRARQDESGFVIRGCEPQDLMRAGRKFSKASGR